MDLVNYIQNYLKTPSTSVATRTGGSHVAVPSRALVPQQPNIIDGEFSEVPRGLNGPKGGLYQPGTGLQRTYGEFSEVPKELSGPKGSLVPSGAAAAAEGGLGRLAGMANPLLAAIMGSVQGDVMNKHNGFFNSPAVQAADEAYARSTGAAAQPQAPQPTQAMPPVQPLDDAPQRGQAELPWWATGDMTKMFPGASQAPAAAPAAATAPQHSDPVPMPQARPAAAPQAEPDTSFFRRNAMMMRDPGTGELIDPSGAASVRGPDLITKMMTYLHNK